MKSTPIQTNFTGGEMSPKLHGRVDIAKYNNCARTMRNVLPLIFGGAESRDGLLFVKSTKDSLRKSRLIPFVFSVSQSYVLEFGHLYMRVFTNNGQVESAPNVPYEIVTPFTEAMLPELNFAQSADTMVLVNENVYPQRLQRRDHANWVIQDFPFTVPPTADVNFEEPPVNLTRAGAIVNSSAGYFLAADQFRIIVDKVGVGSASISTVNNASNVNLANATPPLPTSMLATTWQLQGNLSAAISLAAGAYLPGATVSLSLDKAGWRAAHVGLIITNEQQARDGNSGYSYFAFKILSITSATVVVAEVLREAYGLWTADAGLWELRKSQYSGPGTYPRSVCFKDQRLYLGGGINDPARVQASQIGNILDFSRTLSPATNASTSNPYNDDSAFDFKIAESQEPLVHLCNIKRLMALTLSGAFSIQGGVEKPITPTNIQINDESDNGASSPRPVRIGNELYFVHRAGRKLFSTSYQLDQNGYDSSDVSKIAEHIARIGVVEMAYQREPNSILYAVLADGTLATITVDREENVLAWAHHDTDGLFESVACVPVLDSEQVWVIVNRTINGVQQRQVERFVPDIVMDSSVMGNAPGGAIVWAGLLHLEAKEVVVIADGLYSGKYTVTGGEIELPKPAINVQIGIGYDQELVLLPPEVATQTGTSQGKNYSINSVVVNFLETLGAKIYQGNKRARAEMVGNLVYDVSNFNTPPPVFTGWHKINSLGQASNKEPEVCTTTIYQEYPLKMHVRGVVREVTVND